MLVFLRNVRSREPVAARNRHHWDHPGKGRDGSHGRIDGVAPLLQCQQTKLRRKRLTYRDHPVSGDDHRAAVVRDRPAPSRGQDTGHGG